jgi:rhodanese-related sulfurtransferase
MTSNTEITTPQLLRLAGLPDAPLIVDVRIDEDHDLDPRHLPGSVRGDFRTVRTWAPALRGRRVVVVCQKGLKLSQGAAAWLRQHGADAETLEGGFEAWRAAGAPLVNAAVLPPRNEDGQTVWVTRARPKIDRIACPWLIRRFIDPQAVFLFVAASEVLAVAERFNATPFDVEGVAWSHRGETCTFDTMLAEFGLQTPALTRLAAIVRAADTGRAGTVPEAAGLLAVSLGLSRMYRDDSRQLEAGLPLYDAFFRWCRDAVEERHDWHPAAASV